MRRSRGGKCPRFHTNATREGGTTRRCDTYITARREDVVTKRHLVTDLWTIGAGGSTL